MESKSIDTIDKAATNVGDFASRCSIGGEQLWSPYCEIVSIRNRKYQLKKTMELCILRFH